MGIFGWFHRRSVKSKLEKVLKKDPDVKRVIVAPHPDEESYLLKAIYNSGGEVFVDIRQNSTKVAIDLPKADRADIGKEEYVSLKNYIRKIAENDSHVEYYIGGEEQAVYPPQAFKK